MNESKSDLNEDCIHVWNREDDNTIYLSLPAKGKWICVRCGCVDYRVLDWRSIDE